MSICSSVGNVNTQTFTVFDSLNRTNIGDNYFKISKAI